MFIKKYNHTYGEITALCRETNYLWIGYIASGLARLRKVSITNPDLVYYDISVLGTRINKIIDYSDGYIYLSIDSINYIGVRFYKTNPISSFNYYTKHISLTENSVDVTTETTYVYFLTPGISPTNAKIGKYYLTGTYNCTIDLTTIFNAKNIDKDCDNVFWIVTTNNPVELIKVWYDTSWHYTVYTLS